MNTNQDCQAYAEHLQHEHRELHQRVRQMQSAVNNIATTRIDSATRARMIEAGQRLWHDLSTHFHEEESEGCLDYACSRVPSLSGEAAALEKEHPGLLEKLESILSVLRNATPDQLSVAEIKSQFDAFVVQLLSHEARENRIVQRGLNLELD